jgi:2-methylcitrate dehydratase PrpD
MTLGRLLGITATDSPSEVALRVGTASHTLDYDDLSWAMDGHPSVTLVPSLFALAAEAEASGRELMTAYAAGFEVMCALADPISPDHYEEGWHATATFGALGAAGAAGKLLSLDEPQIETALNIAASTPAGLKRNFGSMTKPLHAGLASRSGVTAAVLAADGFTADATAISGERGFWDLYGPAERDGDDLLELWALESEGIHIKAYPCCYFTHTSIAAAQALAEAHGLSPESVERVDVRAAQGAADALHHRDPDTGLEAKFSMEYTVASAIARDNVGLATFEQEAIEDKSVQRVRERADFAVDDRLPYDSHEALVRIATRDDVFERRQENPPGTHQNPLSEDELRTKFEECASRALSDGMVAEVYETFAQLDTVEDLPEALSRP